MISQKTKLFILGAIILLLLLSGLFLFLKPESINNNEAKSNTKNEKQSVVTGENIVTDKQQELTKKKINFINQIVNRRFPEMQITELNSFLEIVNQGRMGKCETLAEKIDICKYYFAVYRGASGLCGDIDDKTIQFDCYKELIFDELNNSFAYCQREKEVSLKANCYRNLFWAIDDSKNCAIFKDENIRGFCTDTIIYNFSMDQNKNNCDNIKDNDLKNSCKEHFKIGDFDNDGLSDPEEIRIGTSPYLTDTDNDGVSDKEEINQKKNPCGEGEILASEKLKEACVKFTNK